MGTTPESATSPLLARVPTDPTPDPAASLAAFLDWVRSTGLTPYDHQIAGLQALAVGQHVILGTPTGSGKSLVALGLHFQALAEGRRSFYTSPTKALTSEKFFNLCDLFGADRVGMMTGDATINRGAPIICCTTEILAHMALREAQGALPPYVVMDEFHYYADSERGWAWQIPLIAMPATQFLLMSATLGDPSAIAERLHEHSGREVALVVSEVRPVPLDYSYRETPIHRTIETLVESHQVPAYVVSFTHRECAVLAQSLTSLTVATRPERQRIEGILAGARFDSPYGKDLRRLLRHGIAVHHAGLLPKYRLLVEQLAQQGLLKVICGTDTLGVGVNIPIRTVVFTKLAKYDGQRVRTLSARDFRQIAGRAGRAGFDDQGSVVCQAPEHDIETRRKTERKQSRQSAQPAQRGGKGGRRRGAGAHGRHGSRAGMQSRGTPAGQAVTQPRGGHVGRGKADGRHKTPPGTVSWNRATFDQLIARPPAPLAPHFRVTHGMLVHVLQRQVAPPGYGFLVDVILRAHVDRDARPRLLRQAATLFRSLRRAGIIEIVRDPATGRSTVRVSETLQADFSLHETLSLYLVDAVGGLDPAAPDYALSVLSLVEAILEDPQAILNQQTRRAKADLTARLKANGVPFEERIAQLESVSYPRPFAEYIHPTFRAFSARHPWIRSEDIRPKSIAREMIERRLDFNDYVKYYGLERSEGLLLRHLSQVYKTLVQTVPEPARTAAVVDHIAHLRTMIGAVDASLIEAWEKLVNVDIRPAEG